MKDKDLVKYKEGFITRFKKFFSKIFNKKEKTNKESISTENSFKKSIEIFPDAENERIKSMQKLYENGELREEEMVYEDYQKLLKLYQEQISEYKIQLEKKKIELRKKIDLLKIS